MTYKCEYNLLENLHAFKFHLDRAEDIDFYKEVREWVRDNLLDSNNTYAFLRWRSSEMYNDTNDEWHFGPYFYNIIVRLFNDYDAVAFKLRWSEYL
jgi:hypothetical protein